jgi:CubicO group peptidase (beta-lactamase class C family)
LSNSSHRAAIVGLLIATVGCASVERANTPQERECIPQETADGWVVGEPAKAGLDKAALDRLASDINAGDFPNTHALLVEHDGVLVYERYFPGTDERWGEPIGERLIGADDLHDLRSISKSVTSALLGIALGGEFESAVDNPIAEYLPLLDLDDDRRSITLHHVLTMTAGLQWNEMTVPYTDPTNDEIRLYSVADPAKFVMTRPLEFSAGSTWYYSGGLSQVLATVIHNFTDQSVDVYARDHLFEPLGITHFEWLGPGTWTPDNPAAMSGLRLRARDLAKIGSVFLRGGRWNGRQVVPEAWVELSMTRFVEEIADWSRGGIWGYGYQWWVGRLPGGERIVAGFGNGNQRLFILPEERFVVTILAGEYNRHGGHSERILDRLVTIIRGRTGQ